MIGSPLLSAMARIRTPAARARAARRRRCCPRDHLVTVVAARRLRDGLSKRYWIRCRRCSIEQGPYADWRSAWLDAWRTQIETRRRDGGDRRSVYEDNAAAR